MGLTVKDSGGGDFKMVPAGLHVGRCYRLVDLGTQEEEYQGEHKLLPKVALYFELHGEDDNGAPLMLDNGDPMVIWKEFTASIGKKATLRAMLESWRGRPFTEEELGGFDLQKVVGQYCMVNVTHKESTQGKKYAQIATITPLPSAIRNNKPGPIMEAQVFNIDNPDMDLFATFHEKLQEKIKKSVEWSGKPKADHAQSKGHADQDIPTEDVPF